MSLDPLEPETPVDVLARPSPGFAAWLTDERVALAVSSYASGRVFLIGAETPQRLAISAGRFDRALGLAASDNDLFVAGRNTIQRFKNVVAPGQAIEGHDAVYAPRVIWHTGELYAHDVGILRDRRPVFVNTRFSCLAVVDEATSFRAVWWPSFISALRPEDRCHLSGLAMDDARGQPAYATAVAATDTAAGWRERRVGAGVVLDVASGDVRCGGLSMPHSPRLLDDRLLVLNSGVGELVAIRSGAGDAEPIAFLPGFARGMAILGRHAIVGVSEPRNAGVFEGLPLADRLRAAGEEPRCALVVVELASGRSLHELRFAPPVREIYDVALLPFAHRPTLVTAGMAAVDRLIVRGGDFPVRNFSLPEAPSLGSSPRAGAACA